MKGGVVYPLGCNSLPVSAYVERMRRWSVHVHDVYAFVLMNKLARRSAWRGLAVCC